MLHILYLKKQFMEPMEDQNCSIQFEEVYNSNKSGDDLKFDSIISQLQEIVIDQHFEKSLDAFMKSHWAFFGENPNKQKESQVFIAYKHQIQEYLQTAIRKKIHDFTWDQFRHLLATRKNLIDQQILDTLLSLEQIESFQSFIKDYRSSYQEVEMFKTIKSNKIAENKKVKGKDNIFAGGQGGSIFDKGLKAPIPKKKQPVQKTEEQLFVPDLILTIKPMRKQ